MSSGHKGTNALNIFRWKWRGESSIATSLLSNVSPEIELSDYGRLPSPGSESPSGLLNGEGLNAEPIADLDLFFERLYSYYCEKGLWCIIVKWIVELLSLAFTICFSGFFLLFVDWNGLRNAKCGIDAVESGTRPCDLAKEALHQHPLTPLTIYKIVILGYLGIFSIYWIFCFLRFFAQLKYILRIRHFYCESLHVTDKELQTMPWASILEKVVEVQNMQQLCVVKDLSAHDIVMRLMRKENYLIGMINKGVLSFPISKWVPGAGPTVKAGPNGAQQRLILTKTLEWILNWLILQSMFDRNFCVRRDFISNPNTLKKRLVVVGLVMLLLSPFLVMFMMVYLFLRHAEQFYNHPTTASSRRWSNLSKWIFREFNEVEHLFRHRINSSAVHASDYLKQFPTPIISIVAKFISFISGGFAAVLIIIAFLDESLLEGHIFGRNLIWYAAVFGTITAISRAAIADELLVRDPEREMTLVVQHTHYLPKAWRGKENTEMVRLEFETLFQYTAMMWFEEMASIFMTPYLLLFVVPKRVDDILQFIADFTVNVEGVGHVCSLSVFDFQNHGNSNYASPFHSPRNRRSSQGKMEKSFLSFQCSYPSWEPTAHGVQFLSKLRTFRDQRLPEPFTRHGYGRTEMWPCNPDLRNQDIRNSYFTREMPPNRRGPGHHWGSLWFIETDPMTHPYLLDWYYTSKRHYPSGNSANIPTVTLDIPNEGHRDSRALSFNYEDRHEGYQGNLFADRMQSYLEASTSSVPFFQEQSVLRPRGPSNNEHPTMSRWWARRGPHGVDPNVSFLEPPDFNRLSADNYYRDNPSDQSADEPEQLLDWRNYQGLSRTACPDDFGAGSELKLHFDDIYRPPDSPPPSEN
ncbi:hypothetical protein Nepgr_027613 [Nepenthes gracilis]|uniref:Autophagy-related protein 9 n=1 Tax=Nepenthes gracilis TaxID=150966 RepID=A0AAD3Y345_NEPGR|nr:hypothetical protein Nepgr_027613 [Nepenthes gracilis]